MIAPVESVRLLLVEDEERDALHLRELLRENPETAGFRLQWAPGYEEGLTRLSQSPYDLCLVDYTLGRGTGFQFMNQARQGGNRTPMILLSGVEFPRLADEAFKGRSLGLPGETKPRRPRVNPNPALCLGSGAYEA